MIDESQLEELLSEEQIQMRLNELAEEIARDYQGKEVILVGVLKGSVIVLADLARALWRAGLQDAEMDFLSISSYGNDTESSKNPQITKDLSTNIRKRHVLIVEDIVDTGYSLQALMNLLENRGAASIETCVLLSKSSRREVEVSVKYVGFEVEGWVGGYGLDFEEKSRGRPNVVVKK